MADARAIACACAPDLDPEDRDKALREWAGIGVGALVAGWGLLVGLAVSTTDVEPMERFRLHAWLAGTAALVALVLAPPLVRSALEGLRARTLTIDALFLTGLLGAAATSAISTISAEGPVFYETIAVLLVVYALGRRARASSQTRALASARAWTGTPAEARVETPQGVEIRPVEDVREGDVALVHAGAACPVDAVILEGEALVDEALLTGEAFAAPRKPADEISAGAVVRDGFLRVRAIAHGDARRIDAIVDAVNNARRTPSRLQTEADRLTRWFLPAVLLISVGVAVAWTIADSWTTGLFNAMAVLLVACPCALGVAAPVAVWTTLADLARRGLVARGGDVVERLAAVDVALFDKTGTLTEADRASVRINPVDHAPLDADQIAQVIHTIQSCSDHPYALALRDAEGSSSRKPGGRTRLENTHLLPARALEASIRLDDVARTVRIGADAALHDAPARAREQWMRMNQAAETRPGRVRLALLVDGELAASIDLLERTRPGAAESFDALRALGIEPSILTGDPSPHAADAFDLPTRTGATPDEKAAYVNALRAAGRRPLFIGDGFNDAPALAGAWVGVARTDGADLSRHAAHLLWTTDDLSALPWGVRRCRDAVQGVRTNMRIAAVYNAIGVTIAAAGLLHPVAAAVLMMASSTVVTFRAMRTGEDDARDPVPAAGETPAPARAPDEPARAAQPQVAV